MVHHRPTATDVSHIAERSEVWFFLLRLPMLHQQQQKRFLRLMREIYCGSVWEYFKSCHNFHQVHRRVSGYSKETLGLHFMQAWVTLKSKHDNLECNSFTWYFDNNSALSSQSWKLHLQVSCVMKITIFFFFWY